MNIPFPFWPGPAMAGRQSGIRSVLPPNLPICPAGVTPGSPFDGLANQGVPLSMLPTGRPLLVGGQAGQMGAPQGFPSMPVPPPDMGMGGFPGSGLFQPTAPVAPFNFGRQIP